MYFYSHRIQGSALDKMEDYYRRRARLLAQATPHVAVRTASLWRKYPWMGGEAAYALARGGYNSDSPVAEAAAKAAADRLTRKKDKGGFGWGTFSDAVQTVADVAKPVGRGIGRGLDLAAEEVTERIKPIERTVSSALDVTTEEVGELIPENIKQRSAAQARAEAVPLRATTRVGMTALQAGAEYVDAVVRDYARQISDEGVAIGLITGGDPFRVAREQPTTIGITAEKAIRGDEVESGHGWFPKITGAEAREQARRARAVYAVDGHAGTLGRILAREVTEPGTSAYNALSGAIDLPVEIVADPAALVGGQIAKVAKAKKLFTTSPEAAGLIRGRRNTVLGTVVNDWMNSDHGRGVKTWLKNKTSATEIWLGSKRKLPIHVAYQLAKADSEGAVEAILRANIGGNIPSPGTFGRIGKSMQPIEVRRSADSIRMLQDMPGRHVRPDDLDDFAIQAERVGSNAKVPTETVHSWIEDIAALRSGDYVGSWNVAEDMLEDLFIHLSKDVPTRQQIVGGALRDVPDLTHKKARQIRDIFHSYSTVLQESMLAEVGEDAPKLGAIINGTDRMLSSPHKLIEYMNRAIPLPDARAIRRATSKWGAWLDNPALDWSVAALDYVSNDWWKPLVLIRGAWTVRVVGEEQVRMAAAGYESMFRHPLSFIAWTIGNRGKTNVFKETFDESIRQYREAMSFRGGGFREQRVILGKKRYNRLDERHSLSWAEQLHMKSEDALSKRLAGGWEEGDYVPGGLTGNHVNDAQRWWYEGSGKPLREQVSKARQRPRGPGREVIGGETYQPSLLAGEDAWVQETLQDLKALTGDDPELLELVASGRFRGKPVVSKNKLQGDLKQHLDTLSKREIGPESVIGDRLAPLDTPWAKFTHHQNKAVDALFSFFMSKPTNMLSRSPVFRQAYWQKMEELIPHLDDKTRSAVLSAAADAKLGKQRLFRLNQKAKAPAGELTGVSQADGFAKAYALDETRKLLYSLHRRSQFFDAARLIFPFGEAWKEVTTTWARIGLAESAGVVPRRFQQIVTGARGGGFFYTDADGNEQFGYQGSDLVTEALTGMGGVKFVAGVRSLNLISSSLFPALGFMPQMAVNAFIPHKPSTDFIHDFVSPMGEPGGVFKTPPWWDRLLKFNASPESDRVFGNTVKDVQRMLKATGKYSTNTPEDIDRLEKKAISISRKLYPWRALFGFVAPAAPRFEFYPNTKAGRVAAEKILTGFYKKQDKDYDGAVQWLFDKYGENVMLYIQPNTKADVAGLPATEEGMNWLRNNKDIMKRYPQIAGFFAPDEGKRDLATYRWQVEEGFRETLTPQQAVKLANARLGREAYEAAREKLDGRTDKAATDWLRAKKAQIEQEFPGYEEVLGLPERAEAPDIIKQFQTALKKEPKLRDTSVGKALTIYLEARDKAMQQAKAAGIQTYARSKKFAPTREWLRQKAAELIEQYPGFRDAWELILSHEMIDEE